MVSLIFGLIFLASSSHALSADGRNSQLLIQTAVVADKTQAAQTTPSNTPTLTPTWTPLTTPVACGTPYRIASYGNSWAAGYGCNNTPTDGIRPAFVAAMTAAGKGSTFVGNIPWASPTPQVQCSYTDAVGGSTSHDAYDRINATLAGLLPNGTSNDIVLLGPLLGNDTNYPALNSRAAMAAGMYACITLTATLRPLAKLVVCQDLLFHDRSNTNIQLAAVDAYNQAATNGYNVIWCSWSQCLDYNTDYCADQHVPGDLMRKLGACVAAQVIPYL